MNKNKSRKQYAGKDEDLKLIGDPITFDKEWPTKSQKLRVMFQNVAGICPRDNLYEGHNYNQDFVLAQSDITCFAELNVNLNNSSMQRDIRNIFKFQDKHSKTYLAKQP